MKSAKKRHPPERVGSLALAHGPRMFFVLTVRPSDGLNPARRGYDLDVGMHLAIIPPGTAHSKTGPRPEDTYRRIVFRNQYASSSNAKICALDQALSDPVDGMGIIVTDRSYTSASETDTRRKIASEARLNLLAVEYGYKYRVDVCAGQTLLWVEFVRTLQEARFVGRPLRRSGSTVRLFKITSDGDIRPQKWW